MPPWTLDSREQLFTGALVAGADRTTLVDDFKGRGYTVAHFSGQDESYGDSVSRLGLARADFLYDARQDVERRTSRSVAPVSLQVSWKTLLSRMDDFLAAWHDSGPLYLYVNIVDSHFPYWHPEIDPILPGPELRRSDIRERNADHVRAGYANSAANVDLAVARVVAAFRQRIGGDDHAILVTADHGQALYEEGLLGHGQSLAEEQTRVPFILWGVGGDWPEPLGPADVRQLLLRNLDGREGGDPPRARFVPDPERRVLQYVPSLSNPSRIALQGLDDRLEYRFGDRLARVARDGSRVSLPSSGPAFERLVWRWETLQRRSEGFPDTPKDQ